MNDRTGEKGNRNYSDSYRRSSYGTLSLLVLIGILTVWLLIFFREVSISLKSYNIMKGISGSPSIGLENYKTLFATPGFRQVLRNTIVFNVLFSIMVFIISLTLGCVITALPKKALYRDVLATLCIFQLFLPSEVYVGWLINLLGSSLFINPSAMTLLHPLFAAVKYAGIPIFLLHILDELQDKRELLLAIKTSALFSLSSLALIANGSFSLTNALRNPMNSGAIDILDTFIFRKGLLEAEMSSGSALGVIQTLVSLLSFAVLFIPIKYLFLSTFKELKEKNAPENTLKKLISAIIALVIFAAVYFIPYFLNKQPFFSMQLPIVSPVTNYLVISIISALIATVFSAVTSWSFVDCNKKVVFSAIIILSVVTVLSSKPFYNSQYLMIRSIGFVNTGFSIIAVTGFSAASVWAMACTLKTEAKITSGLFPLAMTAILLIQTAFIYSNSTPPLIYFHNPNLSPILIYRNISSVMQNMQSLNERISLYNAMGLYGFIISVPSLLFFLTAKMFLPGRYLISIISGAIKR
jgi:ABC-type polysaccharide transport system permease subunit